MQFRIGSVFNGTEEIAALKDYPGIRLYRVKQMTSDEPQEDLMNEDSITWVGVSKFSETLFCNNENRKATR